MEIDGTTPLSAHERLALEALRARIKAADIDPDCTLPEWIYEASANYLGHTLFEIRDALAKGHYDPFDGRRILAYPPRLPSA